MSRSPGNQRGVLIARCQQYPVRELARATRLKRRTVEHFLHDARTPRLATLQKLEAGLGRLQREAVSLAEQRERVRQAVTEGCRRLGTRAFARHLGVDDVALVHATSGSRKLGKRALARLEKALAKQAAPA